MHPHSPLRNSEGEVISAVDWLGNRFSVGDRVLYCVGAGRGQLMAYGKVLWIKAEAKPVWDYAAKKWREDLETVTVQVLTERTSGNWGNEKRTRPALVNPLNITAIVPNMLAGIESSTQ